MNRNFSYAEKRTEIKLIFPLTRTQHSNSLVKNKKYTNKKFSFISFSAVLLFNNLFSIHISIPNLMKKKEKRSLLLKKNRNSKEITFSENY